MEDDVRSKLIKESDEICHRVHRLALGKIRRLRQRNKKFRRYTEKELVGFLLDRIHARI